MTSHVIATMRQAAQHRGMSHATIHHRHTVITHDDQFLRRVLLADAVLCVGSGALLAGAARPLVDAGDLPSGAVWPARLAGVGLLLLAFSLLRLARADRLRLGKFTPWSAELDMLWAVGSIVVAATVSMNGPARTIVIAQAVGVAAVGALKLHGLRRMVGGERPADASAKMRQ